MTDIFPAAAPAAVTARGVVLITQAMRPGQAQISGNNMSPSADHARYLREMAGIADTGNDTDEAFVETATKSKTTKKRKAEGDGPPTEASSKKRKSSTSTDTSAEFLEKNGTNPSTKTRRSSTSTDTSADACEKHPSRTLDSAGKMYDSVTGKESKPPVKKAASKRRAAPVKGAQAPEVVMPSKPELSFVVTSKLDQLHRYVVETKAPVGAWLRRRYGSIELPVQPTLQNSLPNKIDIPESAILGTLMRLQLDYELPVPVCLSTVHDIIVATSTEAPSVCTAERAEGIRNAGARWITLDLDRVCGVDEQLREKLDGRGPKVRSWFEAELEMCERQLWASFLRAGVKGAEKGPESQGVEEAVLRKWMPSI